MDHKTVFELFDLSILRPDPEANLKDEYGGGGGT
jgi:hypothetical protein